MDGVIVPVRVGDPAWDRWLAIAWAALVAGRRFQLPASLPLPSRVGFTRPAFAEPAGQIADFVHPLRDGSRLHVHAFAGGRLVLHRDRIDPARGVVAAGWHWASESSSARIALAVVLAVALTRAPRR